MKYKTLNDTIYYFPKGQMEIRIQHITFTKQLKEKEIINHSRIITYVDEKNKKANTFAY